MTLGLPFVCQLHWILEGGVNNMGKKNHLIGDWSNVQVSK
jgi:hypothetical protein